MRLIVTFWDGVAAGGNETGTFGITGGGSSTCAINTLSNGMDKASGSAGSAGAGTAFASTGWPANTESPPSKLHETASKSEYRERGTDLQENICWVKPEAR